MRYRTFGFAIEQGVMNGNECRVWVLKVGFLWFYRTSCFLAFEDTWLRKTSEGAPGEVTYKLLKHQFLWRKTCYFTRSWHVLYYSLFVTINWNAKVNEIYKNKYILLHQDRTQKLGNSGEHQYKGGLVMETTSEY